VVTRLLENVLGTIVVIAVAIGIVTAVVITTIIPLVALLRVFGPIVNDHLLVADCLVSLKASLAILVKLTIAV